MKAYFLRHGESEYNVLGLCNGDPAVAVHLTPRGVQQARDAGATLRGANIDLVLVSELPRARQTALIVNDTHGAPIRADARINDRHSGFEGRPVAEYLAYVQADPMRCIPPGGESYLQQVERVLSFLDDLERMRCREVLVVSHHEVLQIVHGRYRGLTPQQMWATPVANGAIMEFELDGALRGARAAT